MCTCTCIANDYAPIPGIDGEFINVCTCTCRPNDYAPIPGIDGEFINVCTCTCRPNDYAVCIYTCIPGMGASPWFGNFRW